MTNLCPEIFRKRVMLEGLYTIEPPNKLFIRDFLNSLSVHLDMHPLTDVLVFSPDEHSNLHHGIAGFIPWVESGCSLYTWKTQKFFTLEIYSCKDFSVEACLEFVTKKMQAEQLTTKILHSSSASNSNESI